MSFPLNLINDLDHIDHSILGNIDPDTNFLSNINTSICNYYSELEFNKQFPQDYKFSIFNLNVRSLPKNIDKVKHFLEGLHYNFSILSFTETWLCDYNISTHNFIGYTHLFQIRGKNKVGGGVSMFIDRRINYLSRDDIKFDLEFVDVLAIEIPKDELHTKNSIIIISIYRPPSIQVKLFTEKFTDLLQFLSRENKYIFIVGDFNVDTSSAIINPNITVNNFQNMFLSYFYTPLIDKFTRVDEKRGTSSLLDNIYTNVTHTTNDIKSGLFKTQISDHYSIFCITDLVINIQKKTFLKKRDFNNKNKSIYKKTLAKINWEKYFVTNFETSFSIFYTKFMDTFQNCFLEKTLKIGYKNRLPYLTAALRKSIKTKHILKHAYEKNPTIDNRLLCTTFNNKLTSLLRNREKEYIEEQLEFTKTNLPKSWKIIKEIVGKGKPHDSNPIKFNINGKETCDEHAITNAFNKYFVQVGPRLAKKIKNTTDPLTYVTPSVNSIFIPYVSENEITEVILSLKNSSAGHDSILASIAKPLIQYYIKPLTCLINSSFENGLFPDELKIAKVIPTFKTGDKKRYSKL